MKLENVLKNKWEFIGAEKYCNNRWQPCNNYVSGMMWEFNPQFFDTTQSVGYIIESTPRSYKTIKLTFVYNSINKKLSIDINSEKDYNSTSIEDDEYFQSSLDSESSETDIPIHKKDAKSVKKGRGKDMLCIADVCTTEDCLLKTDADIQKLSKGNSVKKIDVKTAINSVKNSLSHEMDIYQVETLQNPVTKKNIITLSILTDIDFPPPHFRYILQKVDQL